MADSKELILNKLREGAKKPSLKPIAKPITDGSIFSKQVDTDLLYSFAEQFIANSGELFIAFNEDEFLEQMQSFQAKYPYETMHCWEPSLVEFLNGMGLNNLIGNEQKLYETEAGFTLCEALIARTGAIMVSSRQVAGRRLNIYPPHHIVLATTSQIVPDIAQGLQTIQSKYEKIGLPSMISHISGPSRTADIEKTLVHGAHGPKILSLFLLDDSH